MFIAFHVCIHSGAIDRKWGKGTADKNRDAIRLKINQTFLDQHKKFKTIETIETKAISTDNKETTDNKENTE